MKLLQLTVTFSASPTLPDSEAEDICSLLEVGLTRESKRIAGDISVQFGYTILSEVTE